MITIALIRTDFPTKFGVPRQSGLVSELRARIVFEPAFRNPDAIRGLEGFSHLWLLWQFSEALREGWSPTVRPPRLGGETRMGVFATRSPFRPNPIGLSSVQLLAIEPDTRCGPVLLVAGADLVDRTPIWDIKPYIAQDQHPTARFGFTAQNRTHRLRVACSDELLTQLPADRRAALLGVLAEDPRPAYQRDPEREYGFGFAGFNIRFRVQDDLLTVVQVAPTT